METFRTTTTSLVGVIALMTALGAPCTAAECSAPLECSDPENEMECPYSIDSSEYVLILLDMSGSMMREGLTVGTPRWRDAMAAAGNWITAYQTSALSSFQHHIAVWGFAEGAMIPLWPMSSNDCSTATNFVQVASTRTGSPLTNMCFMPDGVAYDSLIAAFDQGGSIDSQHPPELGGPQTNLAQGLCEMIAYVMGASGEQWSIILEADGNENYTALNDLCFGEAAILPKNFVLNPIVDDWGFQGAATETTWQSKTMRAAARYTEPQFDAVQDALGPGTYKGSDYCNFYGIHACYTGNECTGLGANLHWKVDSHQTVCDAEGTDCSPWVYASGGSYPSKPVALAAPVAVQGENADSCGSVCLAAAPTEASAMTPPSSVFPSLPFGEIGLFETLSTSTSKSVYTVYQRIEGKVYGMDHVIPADVDDSGCADQADLAIIMQQDVWMHRSIASRQIAVRADIDRDGFVSTSDRDMILSPAYWGEGCVNFPPHPEGGVSCWNNLVDGEETDVDCGGADCLPCPNGGACDVDEDCENSSCIGGICGGAVVTCTADIALDLGAPGAQKTVDNASCLKVQAGLPPWWDTRRMTLQTQNGGTFPVPFSWRSECTGSSGTGLFTGFWQSRILDITSENCPTLIQLQGAGGPVKLVYYGL